MLRGKTFVVLSLLVFFVLIYSCAVEEAPRFDQPAGSGGWLTGDANEKFDKLADQHGGFSQAMREVRYRYNEMYFAAQDRNWEFAEYHGEKILDAMQAGFERRPAREGSADNFVNNVMPEMLDIFVDEDFEAFEEQFTILRNECNNCHAMEEVPFIHVEIPEHRLSPVKWEKMKEES